METLVVSLFDAALLAQARAVLDLCRARGLKIVTAESCTGGLVAGVLTEIAGSSDVVERGFVTYSNEAKMEMLGVSPGLIASVGAVSEEVARSMADAALARSAADIAVAVTGVAGPGGGSAEKPVGLVWFGLARTGQPVNAQRLIFPGDRFAVRRATVAEALRLLAAAL